MVVVSHKIGVEDSWINYMYHNCKHTPQRIDEGEATNIVEKLILKFCELQNVQPLVCHGNVVRLVVMGDHQEHTIGFVQTKTTMPIELTIVITRVFQLRARSMIRDDMIHNIIVEFVRGHMISNGIKKCGILK